MTSDPSLPRFVTTPDLVYVDRSTNVNTSGLCQPIHPFTNPDLSRNTITEIWHAEKWQKEMDLRFLTPMYVDGDRHFYVFEFVQLRDGKLIVPA